MDERSKHHHPNHIMISLPWHAAWLDTNGTWTEHGCQTVEGGSLAFVGPSAVELGRSKETTTTTCHNTYQISLSLWISTTMATTLTAPPHAGRATVFPPFRFYIFSVSINFLPLLLLLLTVATTSSPASAIKTTSTTQQPQLPRDTANSSITTTTTSSQLRLQQTTQDYIALQSALDGKLQHLQNVRNKIQSQQKNLLQLPQREQQQSDGDDASFESSSATKTTEIIMNSMYDDMDKIGSKVVELLRRTETVLARLSAQNKKLLISSGIYAEEKATTAAAATAQTEGDHGNNDANTKSSMGLEARLRNLMREEVERRDRYKSSKMQSTTVEEKEEEENNSSNYITLTELTQILSPNNILQHSKSIIHHSLLELTTQLMKKHVDIETSTWKLRSQRAPTHYEHEYNDSTAEILHQLQSNSSNHGQCLSIPQSMEMVARALVEHYSYFDGTSTNNATSSLVDHASYENGGRVVYELTSWAFVPPPRNHNDYTHGVRRRIGGDGSGMSQREQFEFAKQAMFDEHVENMYYQQQQQQQQQQQYMNHKKSILSTLLWNPLSEMFEKMDVWKWYTSFQLGALRQYLPDDWERILDRLFSFSSTSWSDYTPRGIVDVLIPDYIYHALGLQYNEYYGRWFGRTASPEVAISDGYSKSGGGDSNGLGGKGSTAMPHGHCYPLSMRPEDDPALLSSLLNHRDDHGGDSSSTSSLLVGPKYTVRLPYPIYIDAVTFEHRSFPLLPSKHSNNGRSAALGSSGAESAPRWIRVVGFPPCPTKIHNEGEEHDECAVLGFDVAKPADLGSFEYQRINGLGEEQEEKEHESILPNNMLEWRRRSIQTFTVKGGHRKPSSVLGNDSPSEDTTDIDDEYYDSRDPRQCPEDSSSCVASLEVNDDDDGIELENESMPVGQCAPPKDIDSLPSCGADATSSTATTTLKKRRGGGATSAARERQIVAAVAFVIEENWGNKEYTCLYRVRVHGDAVLGGKK